MKKTLFFSLTCLLILSACTKVVTPEPKPLPVFNKPESVPFADPHGTVTSADTQKYWVANNVTKVYAQAVTTTDDGVEIVAETFTISGLKDNAVQDRINQKIKEKVEALKIYAKFSNLPVYRSFYRIYPENKRTIKSIHISGSPLFNNNNLMSIRFNVSVFIHNDPNQYAEDFSIIDSMNLDLNTGEEVNLSDLFVNGSNYQSALETQILLKSASQTETVSAELKYYVDSYTYNGGFSGIRGDVKYYLYESDIILLLNEKYTEFENDFSTVQITLPLSAFKSILALGQRYSQSGTTIYTEPTETQSRNYLYNIHTDIKDTKRDGITIHTEITMDEELSPLFKDIRDKIIAQDLADIDKITAGVKYITYEFSATLNSGNMLTKAAFYTYQTEGKQYGHNATYMPDGTRYTFENTFKSGYDYRSFYKKLITQYLKENWYEKTYDPDTVFDQLASTLSVYSWDNHTYITLSNEFFFDASQDEGDFYISIDVAQYQDILQIKPFN